LTAAEIERERQRIAREQAQAEAQAEQEAATGLEFPEAFPTAYDPFGGGLYPAVA